ncbi:MAG: hypothetical protein ACO32Y_10985 [Vulcanococcus sp.]|jgi:hypothetical protein
MPKRQNRQLELGSEPPASRKKLERLVLLIAQQVGVPPAAIALLARPASLPPT